MALSQNFKMRLPTKHESRTLFLMSVFPIHAWATLIFFHQLPSYLLKMSVVHACTIFAYTLVYILVECLLVSGMMLLFSLALPKLYRNVFIPQNAIFLLGLFVVFLPTQINTFILEQFPQISNLYGLFQIFWLIAVFGLTVGMSALIHSNGKAVHWINNFVERMLPLSYGFLVIDAISIVIVTITIMR